MSVPYTLVGEAYLSVEQARALYQDTDPAHGFDHVWRVTCLAERIGRQEGADLPIVRTAGLLHDIGRAEETRTGECHAQIGARRAWHVLAGLPHEVVEAVVSAIATHRFRRGAAPATLEAQVLFDADKLDALGAVGLGRAFHVSGAAGAPLWPMPGGPEGHTPWDEYTFKLSKLRDRLYTPAGRALAEERHQYMADFFARLQRELDGEI